GIITEIISQSTDFFKHLKQLGKFLAKQLNPNSSSPLEEARNVLINSLERITNNQKDSRMITVRPAEQRGQADHGWLKSAHSFSFGSYYDPTHSGFSVLRVINEDHVAPGKGFPSHPHRNMEIISLVLAGELEHKDSMGNGSVLRPGEMQLISAGSGISHSEFNPSVSLPTHFYQIWLEPGSKNTVPRYEQRAFQHSLPLTLVASRDGSEDSLTVNQDAKVYLGSLGAEQSITLPLYENRSGWLQVLSGELLLENLRLELGDGASIAAESNPELKTVKPSQFLVFDLP
ncbi:MAG: pirin family protein, partial [Bdellovibrionales bacterium]|nr:pirin family protein [Bdellovibrionales bacterium]